MSLTGHLKSKDSPVREFFLTNFPGTKRALQACALQPTAFDVRVSSPALPDGKLPPTWRGSDPVVVPGSQESFPWATAGTAFDYRLRFYFGADDLTKLVAYHGSIRLMDYWGPGAPPLAFDQLLDEFTSLKESEPDWGRKPSPDARKRLAQMSYVLALFEQCFRTSIMPEWPIARLGPGASYDLILSTAHDSLVSDIEALAQLFEANQPTLLNAGKVELNPTFGETSYLLGGADADLIVDGRLLDIKTKMAASIDRVDLWQILGYALADTDDEFDIREVGFYFSRQGVQVSWDLGALLSLLSESSQDLAASRARFGEVLEGLPR